jgi:hypothetical protein
MPKETNENFIIWVSDYVKENPGTTAKGILKAYQKQQKPFNGYDNDLYGDEKKKSNVNSALYQLISQGKLAKQEPEGEKLAPTWWPVDNLNENTQQKFTPLDVEEDPLFDLFDDN